MGQGGGALRGDRASVHRALRRSGARAGAADPGQPRPRRGDGDGRPRARCRADGRAGPGRRFLARHGRPRGGLGPARYRGAGDGRAGPRPAGCRLRRRVLDLRRDPVSRLAPGARRDGPGDEARRPRRRGGLAGAGRGQLPAAAPDPREAVSRSGGHGDARRRGDPGRPGPAGPGDGRGRVSRAGDHPCRVRLRSRRRASRHPRHRVRPVARLDEPRRRGQGGGDRRGAPHGGGAPSCRSPRPP